MGAHCLRLESHRLMCALPVRVTDADALAAGVVGIRLVYLIDLSVFGLFLEHTDPFLLLRPDWLVAQRRS